MQDGDLIVTPSRKLSPNRARFWKHRISPSLRDALDECTVYALEAYNRSIVQISDLTGLDSHWTLRKYINEARMPAHLIRPFEHACGIDLVTRWLSSSANRISVPIPQGRRPKNDEMSTLAHSLADAQSALIAFYGSERSEADAVAAVWAGMQELAGHKLNVEKFNQPELPL